MKFTSIVALLLTVVSTGVAQNIIQLHGSGTTNPSKCYWHIMDQFQDRIKLPVKMTYRAVGSSTGQAEFIGDGVSSDNDFGSGDIPFSAEDYANFPAGSVVHFPFVLGAISFFHSVPVEGDSGLELNACLLGKIFNRKITDWTDPEILEVNPNLNLPSPYPIHVARRVQGSSSTASITQYLHATCPDEWPESLVGKTVDWPTDTKPCEGSGGMTNCIRDTPGTIGYIDSGHGHSEGLTEIELLNKDGVYISSKESNERGGIMAATDNAGLPSDLTGTFADVQLLNQPGTYTWPIVAMSYVYVKKDITFLDPSSQSLLKAFLQALYSDDYIPECEEEFGFVRISGDLRQKALDTIDSLVTTEGAPVWTFEKDTEKRTGQGDYVISSKRNSYSEVEQDGLLKDVAALMDEIAALKETNARLEEEMKEANENLLQMQDTVPFEEGSDQDTQLKASLALASISFIFWCLAIIYMIAKFVLGV